MNKKSKAFFNKHIGSFTATYDSGKKVNCKIFQGVSDAIIINNSKAFELGQKAIIIGEGITVQRITKGLYKIITTGEILTSDDPKAP